MKIEDGKGTGVLAQVDENQRLQVSAVASDRAEAANIAREAFILATEIQALATSNTEHKTFYLLNGETTRDMLVDLTKFSSDGGGLSSVQPVLVKCYINASVPTTNSEFKNPIGMNTSTGQSSTEFIVWDGVGTGFAQASAGDHINSFYIGLGLTDFRVPSKFIIGPGKTLTYSFECQQDCLVSVQAFVHLL